MLVTGRILGELRHGFPDVDEHFDAIVAENGALISGPHGRRLLADPVDDVLEDALLRRRVPVRAGEVLLACDASHDRGRSRRDRPPWPRLSDPEEPIGADGAACRGHQRRSGLLEALSDLGVSPHSTITIGDAENDRSLLDAGEYGVAVANAVEALMKHADMVLDEADGRGVVELLRGPLLTGERRVSFDVLGQVVIGTIGNGDPVIIPASQVNVLIAGGTGLASRTSLGCWPRKSPNSATRPWWSTSRATISASTTFEGCSPSEVPSRSRGPMKSTDWSATGSGASSSTCRCSHLSSRTPTSNASPGQWSESAARRTASLDLRRRGTPPRQLRPDGHKDVRTIPAGRVSRELPTRTHHRRLTRRRRCRHPDTWSGTRAGRPNGQSNRPHAPTHRSNAHRCVAR